MAIGIHEKLSVTGNVLAGINFMYILLCLMQEKCGF